MNASITLLQSVLPATVGLRVAIPSTHPSAQILGTDRMGSGVLVDAAGLVLTVNYVVLGAETIEVTLVDETRVAGHVVAQDFFAGLAVIKIPGEGYPTVVAASPDDLRPGDEVFIVASAGGAQRRVNSGAVSSLAPFDAFWEFELERAIMTTAMNPGVGGGGLFTTRGRLAGVVSLDLNEVGRYTLAVPVEPFVAHREELLRFGKRVSRPPRAWVGLYCYVLRQHVVIAGVLPGTPGERAGLRPGDVVLSLDGRPIALRGELYRELWEHRPGEVVHFQVYRDNGVVTVPVETGDAETFFA